MMRFLPLICAFFAFTASAVETSAWLERREVLTREAERLRAAYERLSATTNGLAEGIVLPLDTFENGATRIVITAASAQIQPKEDVVIARGVVVRQVDEHGEEEMCIEAENCAIDRVTRSGWAKGPFRVRNRKTSFSGVDAYFSSPEGYVISFGQTHLVSTDMKLGGAL